MPTLKTPERNPEREVRRVIGDGERAGPNSQFRLQDIENRTGIPVEWLAGPLVEMVRNGEISLRPHGDFVWVEIHNAPNKPE